MKITQEVDLATWLTSGATRKGHMRSICRKLKSQCISRLISRLGQLARWLTKCTDSWDFKCDSYTLHLYYIYLHYPQNCKETIQKKILERFLQHTHFVRESYTSLREKSLQSILLSFSHCYTLRGDLYPNTTHTYLEYRECLEAWEALRICQNMPVRFGICNRMISRDLGSYWRQNFEKSIGSWSLEGSSMLDRLGLEGLFGILVLQLIH